MLVECPTCHKQREVTKNRGADCKPCSILKRRAKLNVDNLEHRVTTISNRLHSQYKRICECGDTKWVSYRPEKGTKCKKCMNKKLGQSMAKNNIKDDKDKKRYEHKCTSCDKIRFLLASPKYRKTTLCSDCSRIETGKLPNPNKGKEMRTRYYRVCPRCPETANTKRVNTQSMAGIQLCPKHLKKPAYHSKVTSKNSQVSKEAIEREREKNRIHKEYISNLAKKTKQTKTDKQLIAEYLETHQVITQGNTEPIDKVHFASGNGIVGTSVMS